jgi:hypothetical protein
LAGYLTVKNFWRRVLSINPKFEFADFYLLFVYEYFYEDSELTRLLLDKNLRAPESLAPITYHIRNRIFDRVDKAVADEFCDRMMNVRSTAQKDGDLFYPSHAFDLDPLPRIRTMWEDVIGKREKIANPLPPLASSQFAIMAQALTDGRDLLHIGSLQMQAHVGDEDTELELPHGGSAFVQTDMRAPKGTFLATANVCFATRGGRLVIYVMNTKKTLLALQAFPPAASHDEHIGIRRAVLGREAVDPWNLILMHQQQEINQLRELTRVEGYVSQTTDLLDGIYEPAALVTVPEELLEEAIIKSRHEGIYGLLDKRDDLIIALAIMRRGTAVWHNWNVLDRELKAEGIDLATAVRDLQMYAEKYRLFEMQTTPGVNCTL